jgi:hypothetical protein
MFCFPVEAGAQPATYIHKKELFLESAKVVIISGILAKGFNLTNIKYHCGSNVMFSSGGWCSTCHVFQ